MKTKRKTMFRKHILPVPNEIVDDFEYEPGFLCPKDPSCIFNIDTDICCPSTLNSKKVLEKLAPCTDGIGNCAICQCPLIEEDPESAGFYNVVSALSCGHLFHSFCLPGQIKTSLFKEIGMASRVGRKMENVSLSCAICKEKTCLVHAFFVPPSFLIPADLKLKAEFLLTSQKKLKSNAKRKKARNAERKETNAKKKVKL